MRPTRMAATSGFIYPENGDCCSVVVTDEIDIDRYVTEASHLGNRRDAAYATLGLTYATSVTRFGNINVWARRASWMAS